ncbi:2-oxo acid dehydrogenase subunit E2 [Pseudomonas benzenivorans]|uniref:2-oxo acid dehydrogenase subunit E2 n=1 Tax=Pseudomonas benzenivorans TaxID=556533 RepID=A0ABY5H3D8_9PSED|nr:2-oxo acid dehydrogenase subunit E2 [Pseudomonas benzenivorans]UTW05989.1 2-oxo acid dehydrogenase subunit E2 [Pseudomonas benzenivorans]
MKLYDDDAPVARSAPLGAGPAKSEERVRGREIPLRAMRGMIASKMLQSLQSSAQLTHHAGAELGAVQALREHCRARNLTPPSVQDILLRLLVQTLAEFPALNATLEDNRITEHPAVHLGLAVPLPDDLLLAPALFDAQAIRLGALPQARRHLVAQAQAGKLGVRELAGATFTVTNLGRSRVHHFTPILNVPQVAILGIGGTTWRAAPAADGGVRLAEVIGLSLTFDHRAVNGAPAAAFLDRLGERIETLAPDAFDHELID